MPIRKNPTAVTPPKDRSPGYPELLTKNCLRSDAMILDFHMLGLRAGSAQNDPREDQIRRPIFSESFGKREQTVTYSAGISAVPPPKTTCSQRGICFHSPGQYKVGLRKRGTYAARSFS